MTRRLFGFCLILAFAVGLSLPTYADQWTNEKTWVIDYAKSKLSFTGKLADGSSFNGLFKTFEAKIDFNPEIPDKGTINVTIDLDSVTTNDAQRDGMLPQAEWFNIAKFPQAKFVSEKIVVAGKDVDLNTVYEAHGQLLIKGFKQNVVLPFTLKQEGDVWHAKGSLRLRRTDYNVGEGQFADEKTVKTVVTVDFDLIAKPNP